jgi:hypothetical protein
MYFFWLVAVRASLLVRVPALSQWRMDWRTARVARVARVALFVVSALSVSSSGKIRFDELSRRVGREGES